MRIEWTTPALFDLRRIDDWLTCEVSGDVAARVLATIRQWARFLADFPQSGRRIDADHRIVRVHDTPYLIRYRICVDVLTIIRVHHERQDWLGS